MRLEDGISYRSFFSLGEAKRTKAERPIAEDFHEKVTVFLPPQKATPTQWKDWKPPSAATMVKPVLEGDSAPGLVIKRRAEEGKEPSYSVVDLWDSVEASESMESVPVKGDIKLPTEAINNVLSQVIRDRIPSFNK